VAPAVPQTPTLLGQRRAVAPVVLEARVARKATVARVARVAQQRRWPVEVFPHLRVAKVAKVAKQASHIEVYTA
jgi:hypothetical protein